MAKRPSFGEIRFSCPHCGALAHQYWGELYSQLDSKKFRVNRYSAERVRDVKKEIDAKGEEEKYKEYYLFDEYIRSDSKEIFVSQKKTNMYGFKNYNLETSKCDSCSEISVWMLDRLIYPIASPAGLPSGDMPDAVRDLFVEASAVFNTSPKASAALLRLALQHLLIELGEKGKNINDDINKLIEKGLSDDIIEIMTVLRVVGNECVHPGTLSIDDDPDMAEGLFEILNQIVEELITRPRKRRELMDKLPKNKTADVKAKLEKRKET